MGRQLRVQRPPIRNISDLRDRCLNIWYNLSPVIYQGLVASMPRRVEAVLRAKGTISPDITTIVFFYLHPQVHGSDTEYKPSGADLLQPFSQPELNDLIRDLDLPKEIAEFLGSRLKDNNLLAK
ncbi:transposase domain containing protein [Nephila pilipes]|uniref:Transposase domain containing protein n=1 Tax=Nephila pilipes TaxID=299642 RepID=A0A8X6PIM3_NEPPI|nr:transposase domain containing protein [Nephila pilipes]